MITTAAVGVVVAAIAAVGLGGSHTETTAHQSELAARQSEGTTGATSTASPVYANEIFEASPRHRLTRRLRWAPPRQVEPVVLPITDDKARYSIVLDDTKDYRIVLPTTPITHRLILSGGHSIVIIGGAIDIPRGPDDRGETGLFLKDQPDGAVIHIEGLRIGGPGVHDGIQLQQPNKTTLQVENCLIGPLYAKDEVNWSFDHPDIIQTWSGPDALRIDGLTGVTLYQGLFLQPDDGRVHIFHRIPTQVDARNVDIRPQPGITIPTRTLLWQSTPFPTRFRGVYLDPAGRQLKAVIHPSYMVYPGVHSGRPPRGSNVREGQAGIGYRSPGYVSG